MPNLLVGPTVLNLVGVVQNDDWSVDLLITADSAPVDLTGLSVSAKIVTPEAAYSLAVAVTDPAGGAVTVSQASAPYVGVGKWALRIGSRTYLMGSVTGIRDALA